MPYRHPFLAASAFVLSLIAVAGLSGCSTRTAGDDPIMLDVAGPIAVDVESFGGDVNVYVDDTLEQASVKVVRSSDFGQSRRGEALDALDLIQYTAEVESGETGPVLRVRTWTDSPEPYLQAAHVTIWLPAAENLSVHTERGRVYAIDTQGPVDISTTEGDVRFMTNWPMIDTVSIRNDRGDIDYRVRGESTGMVTAEAPDGRVRHDCRFCKVRVSEHGLHRMTAVINDGQNPVDLFTAEGDIRVTVTNNPTEVGTFIIDP